MIRWRHGLGSCIAGIGILTLCSAAHAELVRTVRSFPKGQPDAYLGNGMIGYRIRPLPFLSWKGAASGFMKSHEEGRFEALAYAPYPFAMNFRLGSSRWLLDEPDKIKVIEQRLDMRCGELATVMEAPLGAATMKTEVLQFVSRTCPSAACQEVRLIAPEEGELQVTVSIACGPGNDVYASTLPSQKKAIDLMLGFASKDGAGKCGVAVKSDFGGAAVTREAIEPGKPQTRAYRVGVKKGQTVIIRSIAATVTTTHHPQPELEACRLVNWAASLGFDELRRRNAEAWQEIWKSRVRVTGDEQAQDYLDCSLFYLYSSAHPSCRTGIPPFGLSQAANYNGHVFWDMDTYMMPALLLTSPPIAKELIEYRRRNLEAARQRAQTYGYRGAMYPWESDTRGFESTPSECDTGWLEQHVNMCVAVAAWQYQKAAGDEEHARSCTWPILKAVAEWIESRAEETDRGYTIRNITSAAEGLKVDGSCYVNAIAAEALRNANACARMLGHPSNAKWQEMAEAFFLPTGPAPKESGISGDIIWMHEKGWEKSPSVDMFMLGFPFDLPLDRGLLRRTYDFYMTLPDKTLTMGAAFFIGDGAFLGDRQGSRQLLDRLVKETFEPVWGMGVEATGAKPACFVTTMGGMLQTAMMAFTGIRFDPGHWTKYEACLPEGWAKIEVDRVYLEGTPYRLEAVNGRRAVLTPTTRPTSEPVRVAEIRAGDLDVVFRDNSASPGVLSGVDSLINVKAAPGFDAFDPDSPGASAGLNFEHIIAGYENAHNAFAPRRGRYSLYRLPDGQSVSLVRDDRDCPWAVSSTMKYTVTPPHYIDLDFRCQARDKGRFGQRGYAVFFWANYMNDVADIPIHFRGIETPGGDVKWIAADAPKGHPDWVKGGTYRSAEAADLKYDENLSFRLNSWSYDYPRFAKPFFYGRAARDMVYIVMFDRMYSAEDEVRFSVFTFKLDRFPRPAWDFQYVIHKVEKGEEYGYKARVVWKRFVSAEDCEQEYDTWAAGMRRSPAP